MDDRSRTGCRCRWAPVAHEHSGVAKAAAWVVAAALLMACGSASETTGTPPDPRAVGAVDVDQDGSDDALGADHAAGPVVELLIVGGDDLDTLAVLDVATGQETPIPVPPDLDSTRPDRAIVGPSGGHVLLSMGGGALLWDRATDAVVVLGTRTRILGVHPAIGPRVVLLETNSATVLVDLVRGRTHDVTAGVGGSPAGVVPRLMGDTAGRMVLIAGSGGGSLAVDLESGATVAHDRTLLFVDGGLAPDGSTVVARSRSDHGFAVEALDPFDPSATATWYTPQHRTAQVTVAWVGDQLVAADLDGRILTLTNGEITEAGRLGPSDDVGPFALSLHADPSVGAAALLEDRGADSTRWFHVDLASGGVDELEELEDHDLIPTGPSGHVVVGRGDLAAGFESVRLVDVAGGEVRLLRRDDTAARLVVRAVGPSVVQVIEPGRDWRSSFHDVSGALIGEVLGASSMQFDPSSGLVALAERDPAGGFSFDTRIVELDGTTRDTFDATFPLAWLPSR